ncbi:nucleolar mif4g domain-containing protein 1 [Quercus suber]|uniref:Nucleolar mif4g domain-containing protein 1 n=1 Tax=Quercus suber TaxID=58331 RepID=A0AAW0KW06_QUESU
MPLIRSMHLAKFVAEMVASFTLSLAVLKTIELGNMKQLTPKRIMHFRMLFEALFEYPDKLIWNIFTRVAITPELESLRHGIEFFIKQYVLKSNKAITEKFKFCIWDHFKELESMPLIRSMHLAKFVAEMVASFTLSLAVLKTIELGNMKQLTPKRIMHFRMLFEALFEYPDKLIWNIFTRVAITPELESLRHGIEFFIKQYVLKSNKAITEKFKVVKKALNNAEGVLL